MQIQNSNSIFLTGATGFIGSHVAEYFCNRGVEVHCGVRPTSEISFLETLPVKISYIDLHDQDSLVRKIQQVGFVIHTAGLVNDWSAYQEFYDTNVIGTRNLVNACVSAGIQNLIITGTNASYGEENSSEFKNEDSPDKPHYPYFLEKLIPNRLNHYRVTKHMATKEAVQMAQDNHMNLMVLEPVWVYGEREFSSGFYEYMKVVSGKVPFFPGCKTNRFHVICVRDLVRAYFLTYEKRPTGVNRIIIGNEHIDLMDRIYALFCKELGIRKPTNLPKALIYPVGLLMEMVAELCKFKNPPTLSRSRVNMFYDNITYNTRKAKSMISFHQEVPIEVGIAQTVKWYKDKNLI